MDEKQLSETRLALDPLGSCFSQGYCCIAITLRLVVISSSCASWCKLPVLNSIRLKYRLLRLR